MAAMQRHRSTKTLAFPSNARLRSRRRLRHATGRGRPDLPERDLKPPRMRCPMGRSRGFQNIDDYFFPPLPDVEVGSDCDVEAVVEAQAAFRSLS